MATDNRAYTCYLPPDIEEYLKKYCTDNGLIRKNGIPIMSTAIVAILKQHFGLGNLPNTSKVLDETIDGYIDNWADRQLNKHLNKVLLQYMEGIGCVLSNSIYDIPRTDGKKINEQITLKDKTMGVTAKIVDQMDMLEAVEQKDINSSKGLTNQELADCVGTSLITVKRWKASDKKGNRIVSPKYKTFWEEWEIGKDNKWYQKASFRSENDS